ncbi:MAG: response regulator [Planctomycetota bacterium]|nr:response regulator [Planctomycetota bacterium]
MQIPAIRPIILVVESDPIELTGLAASLHMAGYDVVSARGPETALKAVRTTFFDLAVVNVNLRGRSGEKLREEIRTLDLNRETP